LVLYVQMDRLGITSEAPLTDTDCKGLPLPENV
jgi:hypothetical protein